MTVPAGVRIASAFDSGIEWATSISSTSNGPSVNLDATARPQVDLGRVRLAEALGFEQRRRERRREDRDLEPRPEMDERAEMILMRMGEDDPEEVLRAAPR